jgi:uncharacterized RDD family membrane protein YckC
MAHATAVPVSGSKLDNRRVLAALIDLLIVGAGWGLLLAAAGKLDSTSGGGGALTAVGLGWALYYYFACETGSGQTVGKRAMKIRVVRTDGAPAGMREIGIRTVLRLVDGLFLYGVGLVVMLVTRERRGRLGDLAGGTMIVSVEQRAPTVDMSAPEVPAAALRVPIAESGPAFEPVAEAEPEVVAEPVAEVEAVPDADVSDEPDVASPSLQELASDVTAVTEDPEREVEEEEPEVEEEEPEVEEELPPAAESEPVADAEDEPEAEEEVTVKSVETVSAIDLVMEEGNGRRA